MTYELTLSIAQDSPQGQNIETLAETEQVSREEAALRLLAAAGLSKPTKANRPPRGAFWARSAHPKTPR